MADETFTKEQVDALIAERLASETEGLKKSQAQLLKEKKDAQSALKGYEGVDAEEYKALKQAAAEAEEKRIAATGDMETWKKQIADANAKREKTLLDAHAREIDERDKRISKRDQAIENTLIRAELTRAIAAQKGDPDLLLPYARTFVRTRETDDGFEAYIADGSGNARMADGKGSPLSFDQFVQQDLMTKFPRAFDGTGSSGGGSSRSTGGAGGSATRIAAPENGVFGEDFLKNVAGIATGKANVD